MATQEETEIRELPKLPKAFAEYVESKLKNGKGRDHLCKQLGSMDRTLELVADAMIQKMNPQELGKKYKVGYFQVYRFLKDIEQWKDEIVSYIKEMEDFKPKDFRAFSSVQQWETMIRRSGKTSALELIPTMGNVCGYRYHPKQKPYVKGFKCNPEKFDLEASQKFIDSYLAEHKVKMVPRQIRMAIRHFLASKGIAIQRGMGAQFGLSGEKQNYGKYGHIKLSDDEIETARVMLREIGAKEIAFFDWGIESCARYETLARTEIEKIEATEDYLTARVYESKTEKTWTKYLLINKYAHARETANEIQALMEDGAKFLFLKDGRQSEINDMMADISKVLRSIYEKLGKRDQYFYMKPIHTLRHIGAHLWLRRTNYDYVLVAKIGGWESVQTLIDCYGEMPPEIVLEKIAKIGRES